MPRRLDFVRFQVGADEVEVAFMVALELAGRAERSPDEDARSAALKIRGAGASRPVKLSAAELAAFRRVIDDWDTDVKTVCRLRERLS